MCPGFRHIKKWSVEGGALDAPAVKCFDYVRFRRTRNISERDVEGAVPYKSFSYNLCRPCPLVRGGFRCTFHPYASLVFLRKCTISKEFSESSCDYARFPLVFLSTIRQGIHIFRYFFIYLDSTEMLKNVICYAWSLMGIFCPWRTSFFRGWKKECVSRHPVSLRRRTFANSSGGGGGDPRGGFPDQSEKRIKSKEL